MTNPDDLYMITTKHLQAVGRLYPEQAKMILIDQSNQFFFNHWNQLNEENRYGLVRKLNKFLVPFNTRISLLIRMKLQMRDGSFVDKVTASNNDFFRYYVKNLGENIYEKVAHFPQCQIVETRSESRENSTHEIDCLFQQFSVDLQENYARDSKTSLQSVNESTDSITALDELKKKCKIDAIDGEGPPIYEDNFEELLSMLDETSSL